MADNLAVTAGAGNSVAMDEVVDPVLGTVKMQVIKVADGTDGGTAKMKILAASTAPAATDPAVVVAISPNGSNLNGQATMANSAPVVIASDQTNAFSASATFTPAATSHTAGDVVGGAQQFSSMGPSAGRVIITSASIEIDTQTAQATSFTLDLYNVTPPSATADDGAWDLPSGDRASWLGQVSLGTAADLGSTQWIESNGINKQLKLSSANLFAYLVNNSTITSTAVAHIVTLHAVSV